MTKATYSPAIPDEEDTSGAGISKPNNLNPELVPIDQLKFPKRILRTKFKERVETERRFQEQEGLYLPLIIDQANVIICGEEQAEAARQLGKTHITAIRMRDVSKVGRKKLRAKQAKLATVGEVDRRELRFEFLEILETEGQDYDLGILGYAPTEIDLTLEYVDGGDNNGEVIAADEALPDTGPSVVSRPGDIWSNENHRLICADATDPKTYQALLRGTKVKATVSDPPYGVAINGHVGGNGKIRHPEFIQGGKGTTKKELKKLLKKSIRRFVRHSKDGALIYIFMDWRGIELLLAVCRKLGLTLINLCVWVKESPSLGSFYRSQQELIAVVRNGSTQHQNNIELGKYGRSRSNVWKVAGMNSFGKGRMDQLSKHPTPKPCILIEDIIKDCTSLGDPVLDGFLGSGTTLIAAEKCGRKAFGIELDPAYVDVAICRFRGTLRQGPDPRGDRPDLLAIGSGPPVGDRSQPICSIQQIRQWPGPDP